MATRIDTGDDSTLLPEGIARDVLARAAVLDAHQDVGVSVGRLREIAREAGIDDAAFTTAIAELGQARTQAAPSRRESTDRTARLWSGFVTNTIAFGSFWALLGVATRIASSLGAPWQMHSGVMIAINLVGVGIAARLRARVTAIVLAITAAAQLAEYPIQLLFGIDKLQGGGTKWALILAGALGLTFGALLLRVRSSPRPTPPQPDVMPAEEHTAAPRRTWWWSQSRAVPALGRAV